jgi:H/ACA ribonucleoprotein complex subunit 3
MKHILKCGVCGRYTLKSDCCGKRTINPKPMKYSPQDPYGEYRRKVKKPELEKEGLL